MRNLFPLFILMTISPLAHPQEHADLILINGRIWTANPARPEVEAIACIGEKIVAIGRTEDISPLQGPGTLVVNLRGRRVVPGFNDAHVHFLSGGENLGSVQLRDASSEEEFRARIKTFAAKTPKGRWITGGDWDHERWNPARLPTRALIDDVTPDNPVYVNRLDGHMCLANSVALQRAGITRTTPDPPGGTIVRDERGDPTGILKDAAMDAVDRVIPDPTHDEIIEALKAAMKYAAEHGVTSVQDMSASPPVLQAYQELLADSELTVRVYAFQPLATWKRLSSVGIRAGFGNTILKIGGLKGFADGSLGSTTAYFFQPYADAPTTSGLPNEEMIPESRMAENIREADSAGLQVAIHAIGDRANWTILGMYENVIRNHGQRDRRFRIEHAQHLRTSEVGEFRHLHVIASMQPYHAIGRAMGGQTPGPGPRPRILCLSLPPRLRSNPRLRLRLACRTYGPHHGDLCSRHTEYAGWKTAGWLDPGTENHRGASSHRIYDGISVCVVRRKGERISRTGKTGRPGCPLR